MSTTSKKHGFYLSDNNFLYEQYAFKSDLGSGAFGKVRLATHVLTGDSVAIKIIDKKAVKEDIKRVHTEVEVLKKLAHSNICRIYQYYEDSTHCYIVMEYCNGGEMFDYIVSKERLEESEARFFFRQVLQAVAYAHSVGVCHRDLKPENLMLTGDLTVKLIDFGLSLNPAGGLESVLKTGCGSPAFAAPEIFEQNYYGHEVDVWSMGVLLYVLLCGKYPFSGDTLPLLYKKIKTGAYVEPDYLSMQSRDILRAMLQVNPRHRITIKDLLENKWVTKGSTKPVFWRSTYDKTVIDVDIAVELAFFFGVSTNRMVNSLKSWKYDYLTSSYLLLLQRKNNGLSYALPMFRNAAKAEHVLHSPTIHKSLENDLDRLDINDCKRDVQLDSTAAVACAPPTRFLRSPFLQQQHREPASNATPVLSSRHRGKALKDIFPDNKENFVTPPRTPAAVEQQPKDISGMTTPRRREPPRMGAQTAPRPRSQSNERTPYDGEPSTPIRESSSTATPRSRRVRDFDKKTSPFSRRVFTSLERGSAKLKNLLTPKRMNSSKDELQILTFENCSKYANLSVTSSNDCNKVRERLIQVLLEHNITVTANKWKISGKKSTANNMDTTIELEVVWLETLKLVGVRRRRVTGDALIYKEVCEQILALADV